MANRPTTSGVGRPRARSAHQTPRVQPKLEDPCLNLYKNPRLRVQLRKLKSLLREQLDQ